MTISKEEVLAKLHQLPSVPVVIRKVMDSFKDENLDANALSNMIARDQGLSAKVLRVANSPFYGLPRRIGSIQEAVMVMGFDGVRSLVLSAGLIHAFPATENSLFDRNEYWKRSFRVACFAKALAESLNQEPYVVFTAAMFHEIGLLVLDACMPAQFNQLLQQQQASGLSLVEIEQAQLGFDHALIGAELARHWNFPADIEYAIHYWATPDHEPVRMVASIVHGAVLLESGLSDDALIKRLSETLRKHPGVSWERIRACLPDAAELDEAATIFLGT